jgi:hypothetical protein
MSYSVHQNVDHPASLYAATKKAKVNVNDLFTDTGFRPTTQIEVGGARFVSWYRNFYVSRANVV